MVSKYARVIEHVFEQQAAEYGTTDDIPFHRDDLEAAMDALDISVANVPDIPYAYRSRRELPDALQEYGYTAVILDDTREGEDPTYMFTKKEQLIPVPETADQVIETSMEQLPAAVRPYISKDEQGVLTQVRYADLIDEFTGLDCFHLVSHLRMRVSGREAELDDLYIGVDDDGVNHALAVEAKGEGETLNKNQLIRNTRGIKQKGQYPDSVRTLAVKLHKDGSFYLFEFDLEDNGQSTQVHIDRVHRYIFEGAA